MPLPRAGIFEIVAWSAGGVLLTCYSIGHWYFTQSADQALEVFRDAKRDVRQEARMDSATDRVDVLDGSRPDPGLPVSSRVSKFVSDGQSVAREFQFPSPDMSSWSERRTQKYAVSLDATPEAVLHIEALKLHVPIYVGTSEWNLNRGAGIIEGTGRLGVPGNVGLAAHRDGYFRALRNIQVGDGVDVETLDGDYRYEVTSLTVVSPHDIEVLAPTERESLTLVTCYPFYFAGPAPQRFIVRAERVDQVDETSP